MLKKCLPSYFTVSIFLIIFLFTTFNVVEAVPNSSKVSEPTPTDTPSQKSESAPVAVPDDSVLRLIPEEALAIVYTPSLLELDNRINTMMAELSAQAEVPNVSMQILKRIFGDAFESLVDFEAIGLDVNRDFTVFITSLQPLHLSARDI